MLMIIIIIKVTNLFSFVNKKPKENLIERKMKLLINEIICSVNLL